MYIKGILSQLIDLDNGQTNFDLRLIALDLSTHKLLFSDVGVALWDLSKTSRGELHAPSGTVTSLSREWVRMDFPLT